MIYHLFQYLEKIGVDFPGIGLMHYLSFRAMMAAVTAVLVSLFAGNKIIDWLRSKQIGETVRDLGLADQIQKKGTPTMGGIIIILSILSGVLLFCDLTNIYVLLLLLSTVWCGALGFTDDYIKVFKHRKEGMSEKGKLIAQVVLGFIIGLTVWMSPDIVVREKVMVKESIERTLETETTVTSGRFQQENVVKSTKTTIPFVKNHEFDYRWLSPVKGAWGWYCKWAIYVLMIVLVITACSNGTNLTDGLDGLAAGTSAVVGVVLGVIAWLGGNLIDSNFLNIMYIPGSGEIAIFMSAFVGALVGFLWYNSFPAQVFMGDTGSLTIGGIIGVSAVLMRKELLLPLLCGVFFAESLSVLLQRGYFKFTRKRTGTGKRIWSMAPLHHHYQDKKAPEGPVLFPKPVPAQHEAKITVRFWIVQILLAVSTLALLKIR
ncbi:MAG: phospho-N-acetylmuramoyl-pentapeptide-transferase [Bacteroidales bacterium]|jgi:phospho-N-acetylmuramoyl-pentapeptide-transferase|nr:phospho-N-acetylmuramoyl-pentapeptide-transferase [Bacteroidales bacterium]